MCSVSLIIKYVAQLGASRGDVVDKVRGGIVRLEPLQQLLGNHLSEQLSAPLVGVLPVFRDVA